ncbi:MAG: hypothetical protein WD052_09385 [Bacteroidales bacterium]
MKKAAIIVVLVFAIGLVMSSCNREVCPAMSDLPEYNVEVLNA